MRLEIRQHLRLAQEMRLAPQMIQSMEILQMPALELQSRVEQELEENPLLELKAEVPEEGEGGETAPSSEAAVDPAESAREEAWERDWHDARASRPRGGAGDDAKMEAMQNTAARPIRLQEHLFRQFQLLEATERQRMLAENLIYNIDDDGYLPCSLEAVRESMDAPAPPVEAAELEEVLRIVQSLEPPGVGARDLRECLLLQIGPVAPDDLVRVLVERHLEDLQAGRYPKIAKETGRPPEEVRTCAEFIATLNPKPGTLYGGEPPPAILPDVVVEDVEGAWEVRVESGAIPELSFNPVYRDRMQRDAGGDPQVRDFLKRKMESARWLMDAIRQRHDTLLKTARAVMRRQQGFLEQGADHLVPLKMQEVADEVGVHVSTVSRAISDKYAQTPRGIFPLKYFFTGGTQSSTTGEMASWETIKRKVIECVAAEDKGRPLSDGDIEGMLRACGLDVARRTVTKYRKLLKIPSSRRRRRH